MFDFEEEPTTVPIEDEESVTLSPRQPWPSAYRGSRYSLVSDEDFEDPVFKWEHRDLSIYAETDPPSSLRRAMVLSGKSGGFGSFRITADGEVLTKVPAEDYSKLDQAPVSEGWVPVFLGRVYGEIDFGSVSIDPPAPGRGVSVWTGFPFNHGERWSVRHDGTLVWNWLDYSFESAFDHSELVQEYDKYRPNPGRLYITEHGHIWINVPNDDVMPGKEAEIRDAVTEWRETAESNGQTSTLRLVNRRMVATSGSESPAEGHLPIHLGHLNQFDDAMIPRPVVDDQEYFFDMEGNG